MRLRRTFPSVLLASALCAAPAAADGPLPPASTPAIVRDMRLGILARRALAADPELSKLGLGVNVSGGIATLFGEVPSADLGERAVARVEAVEGVRLVRSEVIGGLRRERRAEAPTLSIPPSVPQRVVYEAPKKVEVPAPVRKPREKAVVVAGEGKTKRKPPREPGPLLLPMPPASAFTAPGSTSAKPATPAVSGGPLGAAVTKLQASQRRFEGIPVRVRGDAVYIDPSDARDDDVIALREALRRLPGVREVVMTR